MTKKKTFSALGAGCCSRNKDPSAAPPCSSGITQLQSTRFTRESIMKIIEWKKFQEFFMYRVRLCGYVWGSLQPKHPLEYPVWN
jgi:hypothetical protein